MPFKLVEPKSRTIDGAPTVSIRKGTNWALYFSAAAVRDGLVDTGERYSLQVNDSTKTVAVIASDEGFILSSARQMIGSLARSLADEGVEAGRYRLKKAAKGCPEGTVACFRYRKEDRMDFVYQKGF